MDGLTYGTCVLLAVDLGVEEVHCCLTTKHTAARSQLMTVAICLLIVATSSRTQPVMAVLPFACKGAEVLPTNGYLPKPTCDCDWKQGKVDSCQKIDGVRWVPEPGHMVLVGS